MEENQKLDALEKALNMVQTNVNFSITLTWTILGVVVAIIGVALYFLVKMWFQKLVHNELAEINNKLLLDLESYINTLPPKNKFSWASGNTIINTDGVLTITGLDIKDMNAFRAFHIVEATTLISVLVIALSFSREVFFRRGKEEGSKNLAQLTLGLFS